MAAADQRRREQQAGLARDQDGGDLDDAVREEPAQQKFRLAGADVIDRDRAMITPL